MGYFLRVLKAEMVKHHKDYFHNKTIYISIFLWPALTFISAYYGYKPFKIEGAEGIMSYLNEDNLIIFMLFGYMSLIFFRSLVQSAWIFSRERIYGTLELIYLSPANRMAFIMGNAVSSLFEGMWLFAVFSGAIFIFKAGSLNINFTAAFVGFILLAVLSTLWGMMLNALFLYSRDSGFLFTVLDEPMEVFAGIKVPSAVFPVWARIISFIFPLTYCAEVLRRALLNGEGLGSLIGFILISIGIGAVMLLITIFLLKLGEAHAKKTGSMSLF